MLFCFDESGHFSIPRSATEHAVSVVCGVAISDLVHEQVRTAYEKFVAGLDAKELENEEPKGKLLTEAHLHQFCDLLAEFDGAAVFPVTLDLSHLADWHVENPTGKMRDLMRNQSQEMLHGTARDSVDLLGRQFGNLSTEQMLRLFSLTNCVRKTLKHGSRRASRNQRPSKPRIIRGPRSSFPGR